MKSDSAWAAWTWPAAALFPANGQTWHLSPGPGHKAASQPPWSLVTQGSRVLFMPQSGQQQWPAGLAILTVATNKMYNHWSQNVCRYIIALYWWPGLMRLRVWVTPARYHVNGVKTASEIIKQHIWSWLEFDIWRDGRGGEEGRREGFDKPDPLILHYSIHSLLSLPAASDSWYESLLSYCPHSLRTRW